MSKKREASDGPLSPKKRQKISTSPKKTAAREAQEQDDVSVFSTEIFTPSSIEANSAAFRRGVPFPYLQLRDAFSPSLLQAVRQQLLSSQEQYTRRSNDLYDYEGSPDLMDEGFCTAESPLEMLRDALYSDDFCHDDNITSEEYEEGKGRRIAYILYLVDEAWSSTDGGALELYSIDSSAQPLPTPSTTLTPAFGTIALFEATPTSFHSVSQVLAKDPRFRLSISGWFSGPLNSRLAHRDFATVPAAPAEESEMAIPGVQERWNDPSVIEGLAEEFRNASTVELEDFLTPSALNEAVKALRSTPGELAGPSFLRRYRSLPLPPSLDALHSPSFIAFLSKLTTYPSSAFVSRRIHAKRFESGDYTLLHDQGDEPTPAVDVWLWIGLGEGEKEEEWKEEWGGKLVYCARKDDAGSDGDGEEEEGKNGKKDEDEAMNGDGEVGDGEEEEDPILLSSVPRKNKLTIVLRGGAEQRFIKMVNCRIDDGKTKDGGSRGLYVLEGVFRLSGIDAEDDEGDDSGEEQDEE
ncbi:hypothetical protein BT69DRAFT_1301409 [Atractiella rhizophila]|nr:hypothetical protein BT69DRAFT_1301409 [Atractiella rhizophila]